MSLLFLQLLLCSYKHLDEPLDEGRFVLECILAGNLQAFTMCRPQLFYVQDALDYTQHLFGLTFVLEIVSDYKINFGLIQLRAIPGMKPLSTHSR